MLKKIFKIALIVYSIFIFIFSLSYTPAIQGDGFEYTYMTESFIQHKSPDLQTNDFLIAQEKLKTQNDFKDFMDSHKGYYLAHDDNYYSYHFWIYSLILSPVQQIIQFFHGNELLVFGITNALLYIVMLWVVFCFSSQKHRYLLTGLMAFSPLVPYITWTHPEVFCASLVTLALVFWLKKNFKLALLFSSLASCQNPPILVFTVWVGVAYLYSVYKNYQENAKFDLRDIMITGLCSLPLLFSPLFYYTKFSTLNLISHLGFSDFGLISFHKFLSYFFDLNQGAVLYSGMLLFVFIYYAIKNIILKNFKYYELVVFVVLFAILSLPAPNWNCGMSSVIRYFVWTYPVIVFYVVYNIKTEKQIFLQTILLINMFVLCCINNWFVGNYDPLHHNVLSKTVLSEFPSLYNPEHEVFAERIIEKEQDYSYPIVFAAKDGYVRKVLTDKAGWESIKNDETYIIYNSDFYTKELSNFKGKDPRYINVYDKWIEQRATILPIKDKIMFNEIDDNIQGISIKEYWGRWSDSKTVKFNLKFMSLNPKNKSVILKVEGFPFINEEHPSLDMDIFVNGEYSSTWKFESGQPYPNQIIIIPVSEELKKSRMCELTFKIKNPLEPTSLDSRYLGFGFVSIAIGK